MALDKAPNQFYLTEYDRALSVLSLLYSQKLNYQRLYVSIFGGVLAIVLAILQISPDRVPHPLLNGLSRESLFGTLFVFCSAVGLVAVRNLVSIRISEVFFNNTIIVLRNRLKNELQLGADLPNLVKTSCAQRSGADYFSILVGSAMNLLFLSIGMSLLFPTMTPLQTALLMIAVFVAYLSLHVWFVECSLTKGDKLWKKN